MREPRRAGKNDLADLVALEHAAFDADRRSSRASLRRSLKSDRQQVWVVDDADGLAASLVLWMHARTLRVYGIAVRPDVQGRGLGRALLLHAEELAQTGRRDRIILEADAADPRLVAWYEGEGYDRRALHRDFYAAGRDAWRMEKRLT